MLRRLLIVLSTLSVILSVQPRPTSTVPEDHHLHTRSKSGEPFSPVIVPVTDPASILRRSPALAPIPSEPGMLLGRHYQVLKRDPSPLMFMSPALESSLAQAKGEKPYTPMATSTKRASMPQYIVQRDHYEANYLSNVKPGPVYAPYDPPKSYASNLTLPPVPTDTPMANSEDDKNDEHRAEKKKKGKKVAESKVAKGKESKKHKSG